MAPSAHLCHSCSCTAVTANRTMQILKTSLDFFFNVSTDPGNSGDGGTWTRLTTQNIRGPFFTMSFITGNFLIFNAKHNNSGPLTLFYFLWNLVLCLQSVFPPNERELDGEQNLDNGRETKWSHPVLSWIPLVEAMLQGSQTLVSEYP